MLKSIAAFFSRGSLKKEIIRNSFLLAFITLISFGLLTGFLLYKNGMSFANKVLKTKNISINYYVEGYFLKLRNFVEFLSNIKEIRNAPYLDDDSKKYALSLYKKLAQTDPDINYIYSGYKNGYLLINNYTPPEGFDPTVRPWYKAAIKSAPLISPGIPYREIKTRKWLVSISKVLINDKGRISGVISIDSSIDKIKKMLESNDKDFKSLHSFVIRPDGTIIIHNDKGFLGKNIYKIIPEKKGIFKRTSGFFEYSYKGTKKIAFFSYAPKIKWIIVTVCDKKEIFIPIFYQILVASLIIALISFLVGIYLNYSFSSHFLEPLLQLNKRVINIINDREQQGEGYIYPDNEIGAIAKNVEHLTEQELYKKNLELKSKNKELEILSTTDKLTGLLNRRKMDKELNKELKRAKRYNQTFSLILVDIDFFKKVNDTFGHQAGDTLLIELSRLIRNSLRSSDLVARWGGEEFLVLCPNSDLNEATNLAERLRLFVENYNFSVERKITISVGVAEYKGQSLDDLINEADKKLYIAKREGRNRVVS